MDFERRIDALGSEKQNLEVLQQASAHEMNGLLVRPYAAAAISTGCVSGRENCNKARQRTMRLCSSIRS